MLIDYKNATIYQEDKLILDNANFHLDEGEFIYLIGKVGSGKSSLLKTMYGELDIDSADKFRGGPVGINTIATAIGEDSGTVEEVYEPYLIMEGFIKRTPRGRMVTELAYKHLGRSMFNGSEQLTLDF